MQDQEIRPGDVIFFRGRGWARWLIRLFTGPFWTDGYTHVGIASYVTGYPELCLADATTLNNEPCVITRKTSGVRARLLQRQLEMYDGEVWVHPLDLSETATRAPYHQLGITMAATEYADLRLGQPYDIKGAMRSRGSFFCGLLWWLFKREESKDALFCSELAGGWLKVAGLLKCENVSKLNPTTLAMAGIKQGAFLEPWRWPR